MKKYLSLLILLSVNIYAYNSMYSATDKGYVFMKKSENDKRPIASITKLMNIAVAFDFINQGKISLDDYVVIDSEVANMRESSIALNAGDKIKVEDLIKAQLVYSANNASYALAKYISGDADKFAVLMNNKAKELQMNNTVFYTPAGLPTGYTNRPLDVSSVIDIYKLSNYLIKNKKVLEYAKLPYIEIKNVKYYNRNKILGVNGNIGLKTGYHDKAGFNMVGLNKINDDDYLITVTFDDETIHDRFKSQMEISEKFLNEYKLIFNDKKEYFNFKVENSKEKFVKGKLEKDFYYFTDDINVIEEIKDLKGNIKIGDIIGKIKILYKNNEVTSINILASSETRKLNFFEKLLSIWYNVVR